MIFLVSQTKSSSRASGSIVSDGGGALERLTGFREVFYSEVLTGRRDALFEACEALLETPGRVEAFPYLSLSPRFGRGHDMLYQAFNCGRVDHRRFRRAALYQPIPTVAGRIVLAVDVTAWLRPDANTSGERAFCHVHGRGRGADSRVPGWPYSMVAAVGSGPSSWTALLDIERVGVDDHDSIVAAVQLARTVKGLIAVGRWKIGDADIAVVIDSLYAEAYLAHQLADLPVIVVSRVRSDRVFYGPAPDRASGGAGRPAHHGAKMSLKDHRTWTEAAAGLEQHSPVYGCLAVTAFDQLHQKLSRQVIVWAGHEGPLPVIAGTLLRLQPERLPHAGNPEVVWLWASAVNIDADLLIACFTAWLRRFDIEHTFRFLKQYLALTLPRLRSAAAADRWVALVGAAYMQLGMARPGGRPVLRVGAPTGTRRSDTGPGETGISASPGEPADPVQDAENPAVRHRPHRGVEKPCQGTGPPPWEVPAPEPHANRANATGISTLIPRRHRLVPAATRLRGSIHHALQPKTRHHPRQTSSLERLTHCAY
ncbi:transposase [Glycomyces tarimensis]